MASPRSFHTPMLLAILLVIACVAYGTAPARAADAVVGSGSPASCTEIAFDTALNTVQLSGGGTISFNCGAAPQSSSSRRENRSAPTQLSVAAILSRSAAATQLHCFRYLPATGWRLTRSR